MRSRPFTRAAARLSNAALEPGLWPAALQSVTEAVGVVGAAHLIRSKQTGRVEWISLWGPTAELEAGYVNHYAALDPYVAVIEAAPSGSWLQLCECLPKTLLRRDEWYNDFVLQSGIGDMLGASLFESRAHTVMFGLHQGTEEPLFAGVPAARVKKLLDEIGKAGKLHYQLRSLGWQSAVALRALDQLATGLIVLDGGGRVIEMNRAAERIVRRDDGLTVRNGRLCARRAFEAAKLANLIAAAAADEETGTAAGRMVVGRRGARPYVLTVAPLGAKLELYDRPFAMVLVADPEQMSPSERDLAYCFGLSPAQSRLAAGLMAGSRLADIAVASGVRIATLRTQLSSILRKVGVDRQADLVRVLSSIPGTGSPSSDPT